jgi:hypothetical protein
MGIGFLLNSTLVGMSFRHTTQRNAFDGHTERDHMARDFCGRENPIRADGPRAREYSEVPEAVVGDIELRVAK